VTSHSLDSDDIYKVCCWSVNQLTAGATGEHTVYSLSVRQNFKTVGLWWILLRPKDQLWTLRYRTALQPWVGSNGDRRIHVKSWRVEPWRITHDFTVFIRYTQKWANRQRCEKFFRMVSYFNISAELSDASRCAFYKYLSDVARNSGLGGLRFLLSYFPPVILCDKVLLRRRGIKRGDVRTSNALNHWPILNKGRALRQLPWLLQGW